MWRFGIATQYLGRHVTDKTPVNDIERNLT
jgi:hypothetical protein